MKLFYIDINNDDEGIDYISLVDKPAVEHNFLKFAKNEEKKLQFADEEKHIISGVVALADVPIYRYDEKIGEYYIVFTKDAIRKMVEKFFREDRGKSVNLQHSSDEIVKDIYLIESYITNKERGIQPKEFADVTDGSWIISYKVENKDLWDKIKNTSMLNGFSLEGIFTLKEKPEMSMEEYINSLI